MGKPAVSHMGDLGPRPGSLWGALALCAFSVLAVAADNPADYFGIQVVDDQTGRGVPMVELETVNHLRWITDSGGWIAMHEPGLMNRQVFFHVRSHGYAFPEDRFGYAGVRLQVAPGKTATIKMTRENVAERMYRITGEGIYRDSVLLGKPTPLDEPWGSGMVAGQDSVSTVLYRGRLMWFWGDTSRMSYPLGHFWMAAAQSQLPADGGLDPSVGINLRYYVGGDGFSRPVARLGVQRGVVWADGFLTLPDPSGRKRLLCHYAHMESLGKMLGHGLAVYNDDAEEFELLKALTREESRLFPGQAHPLRYLDGDAEYLYFGEVFPTVRVCADWDHYIDTDAYETYTCVDHQAEGANKTLLRDQEGRLQYAWRKGGVPITSKQERGLIEQGQMSQAEARFVPRDVDSGEPVVMHRGSVQWNNYRQRWIMIACQAGGSSPLGEIWYAEAKDLTGPWKSARKIITHDKYSFYNPVHHPFFDQEDGRIIYLEGTYTRTFSGNPQATPRYDYNQIMYRLDLADPRLKIAQP